MSKEIDIEDLGEFLDGIVVVSQKPKCKSVMQKIVEETKEQLNTGFQQGISPTGSKWPALKQQRPPHRNQNNKPLLDTYKLQESVTEKTAGHLEVVSDQGLTLGTYVEYASTHQEGSGPIPQRQFLGFNEKITDSATTKVADSVIQQIDKL